MGLLAASAVTLRVTDAVPGESPLRLAPERCISAGAQDRVLPVSAAPSSTRVRADAEGWRRRSRQPAVPTSRILFWETPSPGLVQPGTVFLDLAGRSAARSYNHNRRAPRRSTWFGGGQPRRRCLVC
jgi:hypothetical protein